MVKVKENATGVIICLFEIIIGILLLVNPIGFTTGIIVTTGIVLCLLGLKAIIKYFRTGIEEAVKSQSFFIGSMFMVLGLFCVFRSSWFIAAFPLLTVLYGIAILLTALIKLQNTINLIRLKKKKWYISAISASASAICAVIILLNPFSSTSMLWIFTGVTLIAEAFVDIISFIINDKESCAQYEEN